MTKSFTSAASRLRAAAVATVALALGGCLDMIAAVDFRQNGTVSLEIEGRAVPEGRDVINLVEALMGVSPDMARHANRPMCEAFAASLLDDAPKAREIKLSAKQAMVGDRPSCRFFMEPGSTQAAIDLMQKGLDTMALDPSTKISYFQLKPEGPKRYRMTLDMDAMFTDGKRNMDGVIDNLRKLMPGDAPPPSQAARAKVLQKYDLLLVAVYRMWERHYPGMKIDVTLKAPKIVETNMQREGANGVRLVQTYKDYLVMAERPETRKGKTYFVVFEY